MAEEKEIMWGFMRENGADEVYLQNTKELAISEIKNSLYEDARYDYSATYYLVKVEKIEKFYLPEQPEILREKL